MPRSNHPALFAGALFLVVNGTVAAQIPIGTAFTYQGRLTEGGGAANGTYDFRFILYDAAVGGSQVGPTVTRDDVAVTGGLFTVSVDFGAVFAASKRWMEVGVRPGASTGAYTPLATRQEMTPAPGALFSSRSPWNGLIGVPAGFADGIDNDSGGDITAVTAGTGLTGGGTSGAVTLNVSFGGTGAAGSAARSDHTTAWTTLTGVPAGFADGIDNDSGGDITTVTAGAGLTGGGASGAVTLAVDFAGTGAATTVPRSDHDHFGQTWTGNTIGFGVRHGLLVNNTATGLGPGIRYTGIRGTTASGFGVGVFGEALATTGDSSGVSGFSHAPSGIGVNGRAFGSGVNYGVYGLTASTAGYGGYFVGRVHVTGTLSKGGGSFKIDHPLDPENKYLYHSFVESPDMMNVYNGNVTLDPRGEAEVVLPEWFEALNRDYRYQLTAIGAPGPGLHVAQEIRENRFRIAGGSPGLKVSWQVTGIRKDAFAEAHRIPVEEDKVEEERGTYLHPVERGAPKEKGRDYKLGPSRRLGDPSPAAPVEHSSP